MGLPKWKVVFQPSIFRCYVSFREGKCLRILALRLQALLTQLRPSQNHLPWRSGRKQLIIQIPSRNPKGFFGSWTVLCYIYIHLSQGPLKTRLEEEDAHLFFSPLCVACHCILLSYQPHHMQVSAIGWLSQELTSLTTPPGQGQVADHSDHQQSVTLIGQSH